MTAPIAIELIADPAPGAAEVRTLLDACSNAAGAGGCVLGTPPDVTPQATAVVTFAAGLSVVRVEILTPDTAAPRASREVAFRPADPAGERFRAAGLIAAGLVAGTDTRGAEPAPFEAPPVAVVPAPPAAVALVHLGAGAAYGSDRLWWQGAVGGDFTVAGPLFLTIGGVYARAPSRDDEGVLAQRTALAGGLGVAIPLVRDRLELRARAAIELVVLHADVVEAVAPPVTSREGAGDRTLVGAAAEIELVFPVAEGFGVFVRDRFDDWGGDTTLRVDGRPIEVLGAWLDGVTAGLNVRLP